MGRGKSSASSEHRFPWESTTPSFLKKDFILKINLSVDCFILDFSARAKKQLFFDNFIYIYKMPSRHTPPSALSYWQLHVCIKHTLVTLIPLPSLIPQPQVPFLLLPSSYLNFMSCFVTHRVIFRNSCFVFKIYWLYFTCTHVLSACLFVYQVHALFSQRLEEGIRSLRAAVRVVRHHMGVGIRIWVFCKNSKCF